MYNPLRSYEIITINYFGFHHKNRWELNQQFALLFLKINWHFVTLNQISKYRKLNLAFGNRPVHTKVYYTFFTVWKETTHKPLKIATAKKPFLQSVCYWYNLLRWMFFILCDNRKALFFIKVYLCSDIFLTIMLLLSLKNEF